VMSTLTGDEGGVVVLESRALKHLFTKIRDETTSPAEFAFFASRIMRILAEEGLAMLPAEPKTIKCMGTGATFVGEEIDISKACAVSIVRAGDSLLESVRACSPGISVGKILIQRDESTPEKLPKMFYCKLPPSVKDMDVLLVDPMLATGGSANMALQSLVDCGVDPSRIIFLNVVSCPEGLANLQKAFPMVKVLTACVDQGMNGDKYIVPGLGDFGDRFFNTM